MAEEFRSPALLKDVLRLAIQIDGLLDDGPFDLTRALQLRQQIYDVLKGIEQAPPPPSGNGLRQVATRAFQSLQRRLTISAK